MNLNKYDSRGYLYSPEEARERAEALLMPRYIARGYKRLTDNDPASPTFGEVIPEATIMPYNIGRNAAKRAAKARRAELRSNLK